MSTTPVPAPTPPLQLQIIVTKKSGIFVKLINITSYYGGNALAGYLFDGTPSRATSVSGWNRIDTLPEKITKQIPPSTLILGFTLLKGFTPSERLPEHLNGMTTLSETPYEGVSECYAPVTETIQSPPVDVPFQLNVIAEREQFEPIRMDFPVAHGLIDQLTIADPVLLQERPCRLDARKSYDIIREHVKANIDPKYAEITSDYDFCLIVQKHIEMAEPEAYKRSIGTGRRTKEVIDYRRYRTVKVYEVSPPQSNGLAYSGYPLVQPFVGSSYEDLQVQIKVFLEALMKRINEPLCECKACKGKGVIIEAVPTTTKP